MKKKGDAWISWILATTFFIMISVAVLLWAKGHTETMTSETAAYMEGKEECTLVKIAAEKDAAEGCGLITVENKGMINIEKMVIRGYYNDGSNPEQEESPPIPAGSDALPIDLSIPAPTNSTEILPIIKISGGKLAGCTAKKLVIICS